MNEWEKAEAARVQKVIAFLRTRFLHQSHWLMDELVEAAWSEGHDLHFWWPHPAVQALGLQKTEYKPSWRAGSVFWWTMANPDAHEPVVSCAICDL